MDTVYRYYRIPQQKDEFSTDIDDMIVQGTFVHIFTNRQTY